jgi:hypothetical protein
MSRNIFRIVGVLLLIATIVAGGAFVYRAGVSQGISQAPQVAEAIQQATENGNQVSPMMYGREYEYGYGYPYHHGFGFGHHFGFGLFHFFSFFIFLFFFFGLLRLIFRPWAWGKHGHWGNGWEHSVSPKFDEWHKRAHGEESTQENK